MCNSVHDQVRSEVLQAQNPQRARAKLQKRSHFVFHRKSLNEGRY
jgi:hypothetical protein